MTETDEWLFELATITRRRRTVRGEGVVPLAVELG
jgi:hypothetical protein